ncbi:MAG TPA: molybdopterin cofactor-binding domain-containing protein [Thermoanaerobaculia bacterium]
MNVVKVSRRDFVKVAGAGSAGLVLALRFPISARGDAKKTAALGTYVEITPAGDVIIYVPQQEMGQGVRTALPMIVADELDADWSRVKVRQAEIDPKFGSLGTGGSGSVQGRWMELRKAGATARAMLVAAAAARWGVDAKDVTVANGVITHGDQRLAFGDVAEDASKLPVPKDVTLKDPSKFTIIGRKANRVDNRDVVTGKATFGADVHVAGMLYAVVARSPVFGGTPATVDDTRAKSLPGVKQVVRVDAIGTDLPWSGVAVVADSTWHAIKGREALVVKWNEGANATESTTRIREAMLRGLTSPDPFRFRNKGDVDAALASAATKIESIYELPFLAHATMEPQNATVSVTDSGTDVWAPTQFPDSAQRALARALKLKPEQIKVHTTLLGGGFGRRINNDYVLEAALISKAVGAPVHVQWTREDDMTHDFFRPASMHKLTGGLDANGNLVAYLHRMAMPSVRSYYRSKGDLSEARGLDEFFELVPNSRGEFVLVDTPVPRGWWRAVGAVANGFVIQSFLDEMAHAAHKDPIDFQLALLGKGTVIPSSDKEEKDYPFSGDRVRALIETVRDKSGWDKPLPPGRARGFAWLYDSLTPCAQVAEVSVGKDGTPRVHRVTAAIDCGIAVNPDGVAAQVEGGVMFGLTAAMKDAITIANGRVQQSNFNDYELLRIRDMPVVDVHIMPSDHLPTGTGEPPVPPIAPAVANALFALTGKRVRKLPIVA